MKIYGDRITLSTGREIYACLGTVGLREVDGKIELTEGFDGKLHSDLEWYTDEEKAQLDEEDRLDFLTPQERVEIADYMIARWQEFRAQNAWETP